MGLPDCEDVGRREGCPVGICETDWVGSAVNTKSVGASVAADDGAAETNVPVGLALGLNDGISGDRGDGAELATLVGGIVDVAVVG